MIYSLITFVLFKKINRKQIVYNGKNVINKKVSLSSVRPLGEMCGGKSL